VSESEQVKRQLEGGCQYRNLSGTGGHPSFLKLDIPAVPGCEGSSEDEEDVVRLWSS
jgi:hypothetical protein